MEYPILVSVGIIEQDGKYLVTQRPKNSNHNSLKWEFPGGKVKFGEDPKKSLERELRDELAVQVKAGDLFGYSSHVYSHNGVEKHFILLAYICRQVSGEPQKNRPEISDLRWVRREDLGSYDFSQAAVPLVEKLIGS